eukprot:TRINITY_DN24234_c0_g2_i2.p2 TRINITY_DN24234_c0_g2~~TRINITY_DN24234_c0_g2_i2.p2  ORF type:complete len:118 (+),score=22.79 TRINITY_DN24234_c0_g2_i2:28-381(+)
MAAVKKGLETTQDATVHKVRFTATSRDVKALEKVCADIVRGAKDKNVRVKGPVRIPTKVLHITTRKSPCGNGTNTWDRFEMRIHKRVVDLFATHDVVRQITTFNVDPAVQAEMMIIE